MSDAKRECLSIYAVYGPSESPGEYVGRVFHIGKSGATDGEEFARGMSVDAIRMQLPEGLVRLAPHPTDDPRVVETWL